MRIVRIRAVGQPPLTSAHKGRCLVERGAFRRVKPARARGSVVRGSWQLARSHRRPVGAPLGSAARILAAMGGNETNGGASRSSSSGKLEVRPTGRPVSLRDVTLPEVSSLTRAQMNWQLVRRVLCRPRQTRPRMRHRARCGAAVLQPVHAVGKTSLLRACIEAPRWRQAGRVVARCSQICRGGRTLF